MARMMSIATDPADAAAVAAIEQHHEQLLDALTTRVETLLRAAASSNGAAVHEARMALVDWCDRELVPHAEAEEAALYPAARADAAGRLLVTAMIDEHDVIKDLVVAISAASAPVRAAANGHALLVLFTSHMSKENDQLLPLLAAAPNVSLARLLDDMHETLAPTSELDESHVASGPDLDDRAGAGHQCGCGEHDEGDPELDARLVPHAIRHATVFGALDAVHAGGGMVLVASHDPLPLLAQLEERAPGAFDVTYLQRGPDAWRLRLTRTA